MMVCQEAALQNRCIRLYNGEPGTALLRDAGGLTGEATSAHKRTKTKKHKKSDEREGVHTHELHTPWSAGSSLPAVVKVLVMAAATIAARTAVVIATKVVSKVGKADRD